MKLSIIGVSGNNITDAYKLDKKHIEFAKSSVITYIQSKNIDISDVDLISGGSAWIDHVSVMLFLQAFKDGHIYKSLNLYIPASFNKKYDSTYEGSILNELHNNFSLKCGYDSLSDIAFLLSLQFNNVYVHHIDGFHKRNMMIASSCDNLIAFTFDKNAPSKGGTLDTWKNTYHSNKKHISLNI